MVPSGRSKAWPLLRLISSITAYPWAGPDDNAASTIMSRCPLSISPSIPRDTTVPRVAGQATVLPRLLAARHENLTTETPAALRGLEDLDPELVGMVRRQFGGFDEDLGDSFDHRRLLLDAQRARRKVQLRERRTEVGGGWYRFCACRRHAGNGTCGRGSSCQHRSAAQPRELFIRLHDRDLRFLVPGRIDVAGVAPVAGLDLFDQHVGLSRGWTLLDAVDDVVDALNDLAPLLRGERSGGHINFRD